MIKYLKIILVTLLVFYQSPLYSKINQFNDFNLRNFSNYFSAVVAIDNQKNIDALKYFDSSLDLLNKHDPYLKKYVYSLISEKKYRKAMHILKSYKNTKNSDFFESHLLLIINNVKKEDFKNNARHLLNLSRYSNQGQFEAIIYDTLKNYSFLFENKRINKDKRLLSNITYITSAFENCYLSNENTKSFFLNLISNNEVDYSRYKFFYINYLVENEKYQEAENIIDQLDYLNSSLLLHQAKKWVKDKKLYKFSDLFSCKNEKDILSEFFFLIASLYSSQNDIDKSNFYLSISSYLNPKFKFNLSLLVENYFENKNYKKSEIVLKNFQNKDEIYYWFKIKKEAQIIYKQSNKEDSFNFINSKFQKIKEPSAKILYDFANISKNFEKYEIAIKYYDKLILKKGLKKDAYADLLYRRGSCYERLGNYSKSDKDLLESLNIKSDEAYVLNYLAYSWLERGYKINEALKMLEEAHQIKSNDPYILDSIGWAYFMTGNFIKAEVFMKRAVEIMPDDPTVNDHYGDILWSLNQKIQARYFWKSVLNLKNLEKKTKNNINYKLINGLKES